MEISAKVVKELRDNTGAGMMDCKRALTETAGDMEQAKDWLRKRGQAIADKKAARSLSDGLIRCLVSDDGKVGVMVELNCETDFVARNEAFQKLLATLTGYVASGVQGTETGKVADFLAAPDPGDKSRTVTDLLKANIATLGENLGLGGFVRYVTKDPNHYLQSYLHPPGKLGVLVELGLGKPETKSNPAFLEFAQDVAMHIAAAAPESLDRSSVPGEQLEREKAIYREQAINEGKPEKIIDGIVQGKLNKYFQNVCLHDQIFVKDSSLSIQKLLEKISKETGDQVKLVRFERLKVGGAN